MREQRVFLLNCHKIMKTIWFVKGISRYGVLNHFSDMLKQAFHTLGYRVADLNMSLIDKDRSFQYPDLAIGFNCMGIQHIVNSIPYLGINVDHPFFHHDRLMQRDQAYVAGIDHIHLRVLKKYYPQHQSFFLPHAGCNANQTNQGQKAIEVLFAGSFSPLKDRKMLTNGLPKVLDWYIQDIIDKFLNHTLDDISENFMQIIDTYPDIPLYIYLIEVEQYLRNYRRKEVLQSLSNANILVDIFGDGWDPSLFNGKHRIHPSKTFCDILNLMQKSHIVLNIMPTFSMGGHERVFSGMLNNAMVLTNANRYYESIFEDGVDVKMYHFSRLKQLPEMMLNKLGEAKVKEIAHNGCATATQDHTWLHRAQSLVKFLWN